MLPTSATVSPTAPTRVATIRIILDLQAERLGARRVPVDVVRYLRNTVVPCLARGAHMPQPIVRRSLRFRWLVSLLTVAVAMLFASGVSRGAGDCESQQPDDSAARLLRGTIDIHVHSDPDNVPRSIDGLDAAKMARASGMRGLVLKNHYDPTAGLAYLARKEAPGLEVFGGIDLNLTVGGMNATAVEHMTQVAGGWGKLVWMSTFDAENQVRYSKERRPFVSVARNGALLAETKAVIAAIARHDLEIGRASCRERV